MRETEQEIGEWLEGAWGEYGNMDVRSVLEGLLRDAYENYKGVSNSDSEYSDVVRQNADVVLKLLCILAPSVEVAVIWVRQLESDSPLDPPLTMLSSRSPRSPRVA